MNLSLEYEDKYRLWAALVQGAADRLFVPTDAPPPIGTLVTLKLSLPGQPLSNQIQGTVVGRRRRGDRFPGGVYLHFTHEQLDACRVALGLAQGSDRPRGRRSPRVYRQLALRFKEPRVDAPCAARNLSETGLQATCPVALFSGQRVEVALTLDDGNVLSLPAEVVWVKPAEELAGLRFLDLRPVVSEKLSSAIQRMIRATPPKGDRLVVVVAEEDERSLEHIREQLGGIRAELHGARTSEEVLALARRLRPSLVVLDVLMPGLDAMDICRQMHADVELAELPVVFHSALEPTRLHALADEAGATDYLGKPAEPGALAQVLRAYLRTT